MIYSTIQLIQRRFVHIFWNADSISFTAHMYFMSWLKAFAVVGHVPGKELRDYSVVSDRL